LPHIGVVASREIAKKFGVDFLNAKRDELLEIDGFGEKLADSLLEFIRVNREFIQKLLNILDIKIGTSEKESRENFFYGKNIVLTGKMREPREKIKRKLETIGAKVSNQITKKTDILIAGEKAGSKLKKAKELNIKILSEDEFYKILEGGK